MSCGADLGRAPPGSEERKVVTILFCDLVGFTALSDQADPEDVRATLRPYHARLTQEIERFGGTVEKFIGDAVMAAFGAPQAREDDPQRAVRSALHILDAIEELIGQNRRLRLAVRIGINTGEAVVSLSGATAEGMVAGDVVNTAARLEAFAPPGGILVGEQTYLATRDFFEYEPLDPVMVKGKAEPVRIWRARSERSTLGWGARPPTPFVGRADELDLLERTCARAFREGNAQLVTLVGEPGVGKSRLKREALAAIQRRFERVQWLEGRCLPYGEGITFWALGEIVKAWAGILESDQPGEASAKLDAGVEALVEQPSERGWMKDRLAPLVGIAQAEATGEAERTQSFTAWRRFLEGLASTGPLVLAFEDLHWADNAMMEFLEYLVDWATEVPMFVLCTARPELFERHPDWGGGKRNSTTISLSPLVDRDIELVLSAILGRELPPEINRMLLERADGNPLYAEEFAKMLADRELLGTGSVGTDSSIDLPFPSSIQAIIAARLDTLPAERKSLLHDAAVVGRVFWSGALSYMSGSDERTVRDGLHELSMKELVRPARSSSVKDQEEYSFWHILTRDVAYAQIPRAARARRHRAAAEWSEQVAGERVADHAEVIAHHYFQALKLARAAGTAQEEAKLEARTRRFLVMAGDRSSPLDASTAAQHYQRALELIPPGDPELGRVLVKAAESSTRAGGFVDAEKAYQEAIQEFTARDDPLGAGDAMVKLSILYWFRGETAKCRVLLNEAVAILEREPAGPELARAYTELGVDKHALGLLEEAVSWLDKGLALTEKLDLEEQKPRALAFRGMSRCYLGDFRGMDDIRRALELAFHLGLGRETARLHYMLAEMVWVTEGPAGALEDCRVGSELAERLGNTDLAAAIQANSLEPMFDLGRWDEILAVADEVILWSRATGERYHRAIAEATKARVLLHRGLVEDAASLTERLVPAAREIADPQVLVAALIVAAQVSLAQSEPAKAILRVRELVEETVGRPPWFRAQYLPVLVRVSVAGGDLGLAEELIQAPEAHATRHQLGLLTSRAVLTEAGGDLEEAGRMYAEAASGWRSYGSLLEEGRALLGEGRCLLGVAHREASTRLREAREVFAALGALALVDEADAQIERAEVSGSKGLA